MARKKRGRTLRVKVPNGLYLTLLGLAGGDERKLQRLVRAIIEEKLQSSTVAEIQEMLQRKKGGEEESPAVLEGTNGEGEEQPSGEEGGEE